MLENENKFDIVKSLEEVIKSYNNTLHTVTKATPNEIYYSTNTKFLKYIKDNTIKYYENKNKDFFEIELDDKVLISSNIIVKKNKKNNIITIEKNKVSSNNLTFNILGEIVNIHNSGVYDILINNDYTDYNLKNNDIVRVSSDLFKFIDINIWKNLKIRN